MVQIYFLVIFIFVSAVSGIYAQQTQTASSGKMKITHGRNSEAPPGVKLTIQEPTEAQVVSGPDVIVKFTIENWRLYKEGEHGQHIHFILDNDPYQAHYSNDPFVFKDVKPGPHVIRAFPSRPWHESVKQDSAFAMIQFWVKEKTGNSLTDPKAPMLVYSRPKGEYVLSKPPHGQPNPGILVDWFLKNITLGSRTGYSVRCTIDGTPHIFKEWRPHYVQGLAEGEHAFKLELMKDGKPVEGNFNTTERTITIKP